MKNLFPVNANSYGAALTYIDEIDLCYTRVEHDFPCVYFYNGSELVAFYSETTGLWTVKA